MPKIFEGLRILDLSQFVSGPWSTTFFADQGAEVIKVEPPQNGEAFRYFVLFEKAFFPLFSILNRGKKSITLDISKSEGQNLFKELIAQTDVLVENFVPGTMDKWGLDYETLKAINPRLIYASISGFGSVGDEKFIHKPAFDIVIQAQSGFMDAWGLENGAPKIPIGDYTAGHICAIGISQALYYRERTGQGQFLDISMLDVLFSMNMRAQANEFIPLASRLNKAGGFFLPIYNQYLTKDGLKIVLTTLTENQWNLLCSNVLGQPELLEDPRFDNPVKRFDFVKELDEIITEWTQTVTREEAIQQLESARIPCGEVFSIEEVYQHPQLRARGMLSDEFNFSKWGVEKATIPNRLINFSETPGSVDSLGPELGNNNEEIFCDLLGYSKEEMKAWYHKKII